MTEEHKKVGRRQFMKATAGSMAFAAGAQAAPAIVSSRSPNRILGLAQIGVGVRGYELMAEALQVPDLEYRAVCDLYDGFLARGAERSANPGVKTTKDFLEIVSDQDIDAVVIAVPDHWHADIALAAVEAGKHVYLEKPFTNTLDQARKLVTAVRSSGVTFQLGHQIRSEPALWKARELVSKGTLGQIVHVRTQHYRNSRVPYLRWYGSYDNYEMPADADPGHIDWDRFQANVRKHPFHPFRFFHWRCYWDYTNGVAGDLQSHALDQVDAILGMGIPESCTSTGGVYYWRDGRETPDTWNTIFDYPERGLSINYASLAMSEHYGTGVQVMGKDAALDLSDEEVKVFVERTSEKYEDQVAELRSRAGGQWDVTRRQPIATYKPEASPEETSHIADWVKGIREGTRTRGNIDTAWVEIVTVLMSVESYRQQRVVKWDRQKQAIV